MTRAQAEAVILSCEGPLSAGAMELDIIDSHGEIHDSPANAGRLILALSAYSPVSLTIKSPEDLPRIVTSLLVSAASRVEKSA